MKQVAKQTAQTRYTFMRIEDVMKSCGLSRSSIYRLMARGQFPKPIAIGEKCKAWVSDEIEAWMDSVRAGQGGKITK